MLLSISSCTLRRTKQRLRLKEREIMSLGDVQNVEFDDDDGDDDRAGTG